LLLANPLSGNELPSLGDASSGIVSLQQEHALGSAWLSVLRSQAPQIDDPLIKEYVEAVVFRLAETSQLQDQRLQFILIKSPVLNAFAAPGGVIGVNGGLILYAQTEGEFASVLAHELAHLSQRHFARRLEAQKQMQLPVMAGMLAGIIAAASGAGQAGMAAIMGSQAAAMREAQRYSRQNEQEADRIGIINLQQAGYDPRSMPNMFGRLLSQYRYDSKPPEFLMSHPITESRIADTRSRAEQFPSGGISDSLRYQLIRARVQLIFEESAGLAAKRFRALLDEDPQSAAARYGLAIALQKNADYKAAGQALAPLLSEAPDELIFNLAQIEIDTQNNQPDAAESRLQRMLSIYPRSYPLLQAKVNLQLKQKKPTLAEQTLNSMLKLRPEDPDIWYQVAEVRGQTGNIVGLHEARAEFFALMGDYPQAIQQLDFAKRRAMNNFPLASRLDARQRQFMEKQAMIEEMMN
jgi:predicted Zn-dependent protease